MSRRPNPRQLLPAGDRGSCSVTLRRLKILHAEDDPRDAELIAASLVSQGIASDILRVETLERFTLALEKGTYDLIISDFTMPVFDGMSALRVAKDKSPGTPFIYVSGTIGEERAVEALRSGAIDYVLKDKLFKLGPAVERALRESALRSQRHQAEEQLEKAHVQLRRVVAASPAIIYTKIPFADGTLRTTFVSENVETILGYNSELFLLSPGHWAECVHPSDVEAFLENCRIAPEKPLHTQVYRFRRADGEYRWVTDESRVVCWDGQDGLELVGTVIDISNQKETEARHWESEEKFRVLAENSPGLVLIWSGARAIYVNNGCTAFLGVPKKDLLVSPFSWKEYVAEESLPGKASVVERLDTGEDIVALELRLQRRDGSTVYCVAATVQIVFERKSAKLLIATDVSQLHQLQEEQHKLRAQFQQAQKMEAVGRLAGGIAHDFNNMLMVVLGYVDIVKSRVGDDPSLQRFLEEIKKAIDRAASLTQQLLVFSRKQILKMEVISMRSLAKEAAEMIKRVIRDDVELSLKLGDGQDSVRVDRGQMTQVLLNLAVNARDAMPNGGRLSIETRIEDGQGGRSIVLEVRDTGIGMDPETQSHVFEPFFTTKEPGKGTGLGLANVYGIVKQSEGTITCASEIGKGTRFLIRLPTAEGAQTVSDERAGIQTGIRGTEKILLVEDDENVRTVTRMILEAAGYSVQVAGNGEEALEIWSTRKGEINLVVSDIVMPFMRGPEMARRIRQYTPKMRFLFLSGYNDRDQSDLQLGADALFLQKPAKPDMLLSAIRRVLEGA